jgi:hypothetical protein
MSTATFTHHTTPCSSLNARGTVQGTATAYSWEAAGKFWAKGFAGKSAKAKFYHTFRTAEQRDQFVAKFFEGQQASANYRAQRQAETNARKASMNNAVDLPVGTLMTCSWGYEQTNVDCYKVVGHFGRTGLVVVEVGAKHVEGSGVSHGMADNVVPDSEVAPDAKVHRVKMTSSGTFRAPGYGGNYTVSKWDGRSLYRSWYG